MVLALDDDDNNDKMGTAAGVFLRFIYFSFFGKFVAYLLWAFSIWR